MTDLMIGPTVPDDTFSADVVAVDTVVARGELDLAGAPALTEVLAMVPAHVVTVTVDLSGLTFIDSSVFACLLATRNTLIAEGRELRMIVDATSRVARVLALAGLGPMLN